MGWDHDSGWEEGGDFLMVARDARNCSAATRRIYLNAQILGRKRVRRPRAIVDHSSR